MAGTLRIIFMGTPEFAVPSLEILLQNGYPVVAVVTAPDKPAGRGLKVTPSPVKEVALQYGVPVLQPTNLKSPEFQAELQAYGATLQIVVAFRMLPEAVWNMPPLGTFNLHASLLPQYRGAAPINWAIMHGERETGLTTFFIRHEIDTGDMLLQEKEPIHDDDTAGTLSERLRHKGARLVLRTVQMVEAGNYTPAPQPASATLTPAPKLFKEMCEIHWDQPTEQVRNFIRGLSPYPAAWTRLGDKICKIYLAHAASDLTPAAPGQYRTDGKSLLHFRTADGWLAVDELQLEGKKRMSTGEFLRGNKL
ncbi:MAG: methionyl-tRNA formyltransferase [Cytophagales bacterium]|nr:methionyl-tRNA formyltransferase [Cytophagales bacterium]